MWRTFSARAAFKICNLQGTSIRVLNSMQMSILFNCYRKFIYKIEFKSDNLMLNILLKIIKFNETSNAMESIKNIPNQRVKLSHGSS